MQGIDQTIKNIAKIICEEVKDYVKIYIEISPMVKLIKSGRDQYMQSDKILPINYDLTHVMDNIKDVNDTFVNETFIQLNNDLINAIEPIVNNAFTKIFIHQIGKIDLSNPDIDRYLGTFMFERNRNTNRYYMMKHKLYEELREKYNSMNE